VVGKPMQHCKVKDSVKQTLKGSNTMSVSTKAHTITTAFINQLKTQYPALNIYLAEKKHGWFYGVHGSVFIYIALDIFNEIELDVWENGDQIYLKGGNLPRPSFLHTREHFNNAYNHILNLIHSQTK